MRIYLLKVNNRNTRRRCEICSKLTMKVSGVFIVNSEHISYAVLVFLLLTLNMQLPTGKTLEKVSLPLFSLLIVSCEQILVLFHKIYFRPNRHLPVSSNNRNPRKRCELCSKLIIKTPESF